MKRVEVYLHENNVPFVEIEDGKVYLQEGNTTYEYRAEDLIPALETLMTNIVGGSAKKHLATEIAEILQDWDCVAVARDHEGDVLVAFADTMGDAWRDWEELAE
jgi:hypothetical protein